MTTVSNLSAGRYQAALGCLGKRIARISAQIDAERANPNNNELLEALIEQREQLTDVQESLSPTDDKLIDQLLAEG